MWMGEASSLSHPRSVVTYPDHVEDAIYERLRQQLAGRPAVARGRQVDLRYRPSWRPTQPDHLDRLITDAS